MADPADDPETLVLSKTHRGLVTLLLVVATLMQSLDSTIANVALPYMQGSLSASYNEITWVLTSYVTAAAIMTAPVGWLTSRYGRKRLFLVCLIGFTVTSVLCGLATSLPEIILDRLLQGVFGAALVPLSQSTLLDIYPIEQRGAAMSTWGMGVMLGPILGPTLGGYLTAYYNWRFVFFVNLPIGIIAIIGLVILMPAAASKRTMRFDWTGFLVLSMGLASLQIMLDRGETLDWFSSSTIEIAAILAALGFYLFTVHMCTAKNPFIPRAVFTDINFNAGLVTMLSVGITLLASSALLAPYLETLGNYPVAAAGFIMAPRGIGTMSSMLIAGRLVNKIDPRLLMMCGYTVLGLSVVMLEGWTPAVSQSYMMLTIILQGIGLGFVFVPLQVTSFYTLSPALRNQGTALFSLVRNVGSAIGVSATSAILDHQSQYEHAVLAQYVTPFARPLQVGGAVSLLLNPATTGASALNAIIDTQSQIIAYSDDYKFLLFSTVPAVLCLLFMRKPPALVAAIPATAPNATIDRPTTKPATLKR